MILCTDVSKSYAGQRVLHELNLIIEPGISALLGENGAGKSTLLRLLSGLESPDHGYVAICGMQFDMDAIEIRRRFGVVSEGLGLFESLTILENLLATGSVYGLRSGETESRARDLLHLMGLTEDKSKTMRTCSFGMRKKTAIAMALLFKPNVLVLDEPFEGVDLASAATIQRLLKQLASQGATILFTSHMSSLVQSLADRVFILHHGKITTCLSAEEIKAGVENAYDLAVGRSEQEIPAWLIS